LKKTEADAPTYTKAQFLSSKQFTPIQKDVLRSLLNGDELYTLDQVHKLLESYAKRTVK
jgi:hypothetical protein